MAETVGLTASIASLAALTGELKKAGYWYVFGDKDARKDIKDLVSFLPELERTLIPLQTEAAARKLSSSSGTASVEMLLLECQEFLNRLKPLLEPELSGQRKNRFRFRRDILKWPLKESETMEGTDKIRQLHTALSLSIQL